MDCTEATTFVIGGIEVLHRLGGGGMGDVYFGRHAVTGMQVAVKIIKPGMASRERFINEARLGLDIAHENLVRVYNAGDEDGRLFLVMELLPGGTVRDCLRAGRMPWRRALELLLQAARGLAALHRAGIVHRDVKPSNMVFAASGELKLTDFGLAKRRVEVGDLTRSTDRLGSPAYTAPEQVLDPSEADARSDIYSLGISFFEMLTGTPPFRTATDTDICFQHLHQPLPDVRVLAADVPARVAELLQRMTAKEPLQRLPDGDAVAREVARLLGHAGAAPLALPRFGLPALALAALAALAAMGFTSLRGGPHPDGWQTPQRAVFVIAKDLAPDAVERLYAGLRRTGLELVERQEIDRVLRKPDFGGDDLADPATAVRVGHLVGGHVALFAQPAGERLALRTVELETSLLRGSELAAGDDAGTAERLVRETVRELPARGTVVAGLGDGRWRISLGRRHGIQPDDRFVVYAGNPEHAGPALGRARVVELDAATAVVALDGRFEPGDASPVEKLIAP